MSFYLCRTMEDSLNSRIGFMSGFSFWASLNPIHFTKFSLFKVRAIRVHLVEKVITALQLSVFSSYKLCLL